MKLLRDTYGSQGIFSRLYDDAGNLVCEIAEHAYQDSAGAWKPKVPHGSFECVYGPHSLHSGPIQTFEITGVAGHGGILIHPGNYPQKDSDGCLLPGRSRDLDKGTPIVSASRFAWAHLMSVLGTDPFILQVADA